MNLTGKELDENKIWLLNLDPKFVPSYNRQPSQTTEICALELENDWYFEKAERLWQGLSKILSKDVNKKHRNNLTIGQRNAIRGIKKDANLKVYPFDKGSGFVVMKEEDAIKNWITNCKVNYNRLRSNNNPIEYVSERTSQIKKRMKVW